MGKSNRKIISTEEAARILGVSQQSVRKWCQSGKIRAKTTPGGFYKIERSDLESFRQKYNMPNLDASEVVLIVDENEERIKFLSGLLEMLDYEIETATDLIGIGIAIGNAKPSFIIASTKLTRLNLDELLSAFSYHPETKNLSVLIIGEEGYNPDKILSKYGNSRKISVLYEPLDIHQFKREVEALS